MCWPPDDFVGNTLMATNCRTTGITGDTDRKTTEMNNNKRDLRWMRNETTMSVAHSMNNQFSRLFFLEKCVVCAHSIAQKCPNIFDTFTRSVKPVEHKQHSPHYSITHRAFLFTGRITMGSIVQSSIGLENRSFFHLDLRRRTHSLDEYVKCL